jgi:hypothetical protein
MAFQDNPWHAAQGRWCWAIALAARLLAGPALGEEQPPENKDAPRLLVATPLGAALGTTTKIKLRGLKLEGATSVRLLLGDGPAPAEASVKQLSAGKAEVPGGQEAARVGDTQVEVELTLPAQLADGPLRVVVITPAGESAAHELLVGRAGPPVAEQEPNDGFRRAQVVAVGQTVEGSVHEARNVDVFRIELQAGQRLTAETRAARHGSALDPLLTCYDARGTELASNDDAEPAGDARLEFTAPSAGVYYLVLQDAHDLGGPAQVYWLAISPAP